MPWGRKKVANEVEIEIMKEYRSCWTVGMRKTVSADFAHELINGGYAKRVDKPARHKMVTDPPKEKRHYYVG